MRDIFRLIDYLPYPNKPFAFFLTIKMRRAPQVRERAASSARPFLFRQGNIHEVDP
jgi:hypothetical protein